MVRAPLTQSEIESLAAEAVSSFHREQNGRAPGRCQAFLVGDLLVVRLEDTFTQIEQDLVRTDEGKKLVQSSRRDLRALIRRQVEEKISSAIGIGIQRSFCDTDVRNGMQVEVYQLDHAPELEPKA
jgi:uncharacterized protein YbcI